MNCIFDKISSTFLVLKTPRLSSSSCKKIYYNSTFLSYEFSIRKFMEDLLKAIEEADREIEAMGDLLGKNEVVKVKL